MRAPWKVIAALAAIAVLWPLALVTRADALERRASWPRVDEPPALSPLMILGHLGYEELGADLAWIRMLVYNGSKHVDGTSVAHLESLVDTVIALDPRFERVYTWAGYAMAIKDGKTTPESYRASVKYLERGIEAFPGSWELHWVLGQRYWFDLKADSKEERRRYKERGAELIEKAMRKPDAPDRLATLAATMRTELGQRQRALRELRQMALTTEDPAARAKILARYRHLAEDSDLADDLERAQEQFEAAHDRHLPYAPADLYILLGPPPPDAFDLDTLATPRNLFGTPPRPLQHEVTPRPPTPH